MVVGAPIRTAALLATGEELIRGVVADGNSAWLAQRLRPLGIELVEIRVVGDGLVAIRTAIEELTRRADLVVIGGGLGPTADDRTRDALAAAAQVELVVHPEAARLVAGYFARLGRSPSASNDRQALLPVGAAVVPNPTGSAPGIDLRIGTARVVALPGVPGELRAMFEPLLPELRATAAALPFAERLLQVVGLPESVVGERVARWMGASEAPLVSDIVRHGVVTITACDRDDAAGRARLDAAIADMRSALGTHLFAEGEVTLAAHLVARLRERGERLAVAESCTGGLLAAAVTDVPGSSDIFVEGVVSYANEAKRRALGVTADALRDHGAVSEVVARAMAEGVRARVGATWGVATTGVAGPSGGTPETPVGLVHLAVAGARSTVHLRRQFPGDRDSVRRFAVVAALDLLRRQLV